MDFIKQLAPYAVKYMKQEGILASLTLAQAVLESGSGKSELAVKANNLFGMKMGPTWKGESYRVKTKEFVNNTWIEVMADFCKFDSWEQCIEYRSSVFLKRERYKPIWNVTDYKQVSQAIYKCGYATDPNYPQKLIKTIEDLKLYQYDKESDGVMNFVISSGHSLYVRGAGKFLDEVNEARKVVDKVAELMKKAGHAVYTFHDNTSRTVPVNLSTIVKYHNSKNREIDVSVHFNAGGGTGVEVLYYDNKELAEKVSLAISKATGFTNRGAKQRKDLAFLNGTKKPAILIEVCFVDNENDAKVYNQKFNQICEAIAEALGGKKVVSETPKQPQQTDNGKVMWDGMELKKSQIGRLTILKPINLWKDNEEGKLEMVRVLNPPEIYRVYGYRDKHQGQYDVGAGLWVTKMDGYVKYETPSKALLEKLK